MGQQRPEGWPMGGLLGSLGQQQAAYNLTWSDNTANVQNTRWTMPSNITKYGLDLPSPPPEPGPEDEVAWLKRRVREVMWQP